MERTFPGAILIIFIAWLVGNFLYDANKNLKEWSKSCRRGVENKDLRNFALYEIAGSGILVLVVTLVVINGFFWG